LEEAKVSLEEKVIYQKQAAEKYEAEKAKRPEHEKLSASIVTAKNELPKYEELELIKAKVSELAASINVELESKKDYLLKSATPIVGVCEFEAIEDLIDKESVTLQTSEKSLKKEISDCEEKIKEKEQLSTEIQNNENLLKEKTTLYLKRNVKVNASVQRR